MINFFKSCQEYKNSLANSDVLGEQESVEFAYYNGYLMMTYFTNESI
jgi:hypothetical protein